MCGEFNATHVKNAGEGRIKYDIWVPSWRNCMSSGAISQYKRSTGGKRVYVIGLKILSLQCFWNIEEIFGVELSVVNKAGR